MVIKSEGRIYLQSFHQSERSTIRKAKLFVVVAHKDFPRPVFILLRNLYQAGDLLLTQTFTETDGCAMTHVELNQGDGLIENLGTGNQRACEVLDELAGCDVVSIVFVHEGIPGTGVRESQGGRHAVIPCGKDRSRERLKCHCARFGLSRPTLPGPAAGKRPGPPGLLESPGGEPFGVLVGREVEGEGIPLFRKPPGLSLPFA